MDMGLRTSLLKKIFPKSVINLITMNFNINFLQIGHKFSMVIEMMYLKFKT